MKKQSIGEVIAELEVYNKENGTHYTYGQYVLMRENE